IIHWTVCRTSAQLSSAQVALHSSLARTFGTSCTGGHLQSSSGAWVLPSWATHSVDLRIGSDENSVSMLGSSRCRKTTGHEDSNSANGFQEPNVSSLSSSTELPGGQVLLASV